MNELDRVLQAAEEWHARGLDFALATVVGVRGSTYRGLGARQLVGQDGAGVGTVSGGCLDNDLRRVAEEVMSEGTPRLTEFDLTADDEAVWGWGIGCNGATELIVEPASSVMELIRRLRAVQRPLMVLHHLDDEVGQRTLLGPEEVGQYGEVAVRAMTEGWNTVTEINGGPVMIEVLGSPRRLVICGAGHDAAPLVRLGAELGFEPALVDDRRPFLSAERFPGATQLIHAQPSELAQAVELDPSVSVVIMSHNYLRDLDYLESVLGHGVPYIGMLGPGKRLRRLLDDLAEKGVVPDANDTAALHGPAGLDIGAEGPTEIAWSVLSEIMAVRRRATGGFLRDRKGPDLSADYDELSTATEPGESDED